MSESIRASTHCVDIIVPTYNYGRYLGRCLDSILAQRYGDFSVLVIDNASEDETQALMADYCQRDARIRYVRNETNIGPSLSVLKAYEMTQAPYWVMLCADDYWQPGFLQACLQQGLLAHPECGFAYSNASRLLDGQLIPRTGLAMPRLATGVHSVLPFLCLSNWIFPSFCVIDRRRFDAVGGVRRSLQTFNRPDSLRKGSLGDHYVVARLAAHHPAYVVDERLGVYRVHSASDTASMGIELVEEVALLYDTLYFDNDLFGIAERYLAKINQSGRILTCAGLARSALDYLCNPRTAALLGDARRDILRLLVECVPRMPLDLEPEQLTGSGYLEHPEAVARLGELLTLPYDQWRPDFLEQGLAARP